MQRLLLLCMLLAACSHSRPTAAPPQSMEQETAPPATRLEPGTPSPTPSPAEAKLWPPSDPRSISDDQLPTAIRERKARLLTRVAKLTRDEAELVCFTLELIARDEVFDDSV